MDTADMSVGTLTARGLQIFMDSKSYYIILGDWGTSCGRLYLCQINLPCDISIIEQQEINGVKFIRNHSQVFEQATRIWLESYSIEFAVLCGTITANIGWVETPYLEAPVKYADISSRLKCVRFKNLDLYFVSGIAASENPLGFPDTMRGEETQILGFLSHSSPKSKQLICLPGTHTKWVDIENDTILNVQTSFSGELYEVLYENSILVEGKNNIGYSRKDFIEGINVSGSLHAPSLTHTLFGVRARTLLGETGSVSAANFLSGLIIGNDIAQIRQRRENTDITIIGNEDLICRYGAALSAFNMEYSVLDGQDCVLKGLEYITQAILKAHYLQKPNAGYL